MKTRSFIAALLLSPVLSSAQQAAKPPAILGTWRSTTKHADGTVTTSTVRFTQNQKFTSSTTANEKLLMQASGSWTLKEKKLKWTFESSSHPAITPGDVDIDEVVSVSDKELKLLPKMVDKVQTYQRVR